MNANQPAPPALEMIGVTRTFPGVVANDDVDFALEQGEVHALLGENGAGKTTLMKIAHGFYRPQKGEIRLFGKAVRIENASHAIRLGVGMVHQHFSLVPTMTAAENIVLGREILKKGVFLDMKTAADKIGRLSEEFGMEIDPDALVEYMPVGLRQRVEILKVLYREAKILILDEPTAVLTPDESEKLFSALKNLTGRGKSIVFITHKLDEVMRTADKITILRNGRVTGNLTPKQTSERELASLMVGKPVSFSLEKREFRPGKPVLRVEHLSVEDDRGALAVDSVSFRIREGEIYGVAGVQNNGQTQLVEALAGLRRCLEGRVLLDEQEIGNRSPRRVFDAGVAHIPEDGHRHGMAGAFSIAENLALTSYRRPPFSRHGILDFGKIFESARRLMRDYDIRASGITARAGNLSGGNQQKMVAAREMSKPIRLLIASQPTRGIDVGAAEFIRRRILALRDQGCAVLLVSAELDEIFSLSDRIGVMYRGRIFAETPGQTADRNKIGLWMAGVL